MQTISKLALIGLSATLIGCSSGDGSDSICSAFGTSGNTATTTGDMQIDNPSAARDGSLSSFAEIYSSAGVGGTTVFNVKGSPRNDRYAGALVKIPSGMTAQFDVITRRNGNLVGSRQAGTYTATGSTSCPGRCANTGSGQHFFGAVTDGEYDEIELTVTVSGTTADAFIYELCTQSR